jgi:hypothetical protein
MQAPYTAFWAASVHLQTHPSILADALHGSEFTVAGSASPTFHATILLSPKHVQILVHVLVHVRFLL